MQFSRYHVPTCTVMKEHSMEKIESSRIYLRHLTPQDATERYAAWLNDQVVNQYLEIRYMTHSIESCSEFIAATNKDPNSHLFGIFLNEDDNHIGNIKLGFIDSRYAHGQLSLFIGERKAWGKGFATEAIHSLTHYGFDKLGLERIEAGCYESNIASLRAFLKSHYQVEGFLRKKVISGDKRESCFWMAALKQEWHAAQR